MYIYIYICIYIYIYMYLGLTRGSSTSDQRRCSIFSFFYQTRVTICIRRVELYFILPV